MYLHVYLMAVISVKDFVMCLDLRTMFTHTGAPPQRAVVLYQISDALENNMIVYMYFFVRIIKTKNMCNRTVMWSRVLSIITRLLITVGVSACNHEVRNWV